MNAYATIILVTLLLDYALKLTADFLNVKALHDEVPGEFTDVYDAETYRKSQEYTRLTTRFGLVISTFDLLVLLAFWFLGGFQILDVWIRGFGLGSVATGIVYMGALMLGQGILSLPRSVYSTFGIEERFGFNRTTPRVFVLDMLKGFLLAALLGTPILAAVLLFFERTGELAWLYCWIATTAFLLFIQYIFPTWIMPLFNRFEPLTDGELKDALLGYAERVDFRLDGIFVIDGSKRSSRANAFFSGFGRNKRVALFDTLLEKQSVPELVAVVAHEVGHYKKHHLVKGLVLALVHTGVMFFLLSIFLRHEGLFTAFQVEEVSIYTGLVFFGLLYAPIELILQIVLHQRSRVHEFEADHFAATTAEPLAMVSALKKLSVDNLANLTPHPFYVFLNYSHPPLLERIAALRAQA
jgi:STE24 endopeptidase